MVVTEISSAAQPQLAAESEALIRLVGVVRRYKMGSDTVEAVAGVDLEIARGEFVALVGSSGSGKSTLLNLIGGLDKPTEGAVWVGDANLAVARKPDLVAHRRRRVGFIFQQFNLLPQLTAIENVEIPLMLAAAAPQQRHERAAALLAEVGLAARTGHRPSELSGGEQQRVAIARSLANNPQVLLADEPTGNLDSTNGDSVMRLLRRLNKQQGLTLIVVTHDSVVAGYADRIIRLRDGKIVAIEHPDHSAEVQADAL